MKTRTDEQHRTNRHDIKPRHIRVPAISGIVLVSSMVSAVAGDDFEQTYYRNMLQDPDQPVLEAEARGRVTIYDGIDNREIELAMDSQFNRIDNMMFVHTRYVNTDGSYDEDDDCD